MNALQIKGEIAKQMTIKEVKKGELGKICERSQATMYERWKNFEKMTLGDLIKIGGYLDMTIHME